MLSITFPNTVFWQLKRCLLWMKANPWHNEPHITNIVVKLFLLCTITDINRQMDQALFHTIRVWNLYLEIVTYNRCDSLSVSHRHTIHVLQTRESACATAAVSRVSVMVLSQQSDTSIYTKRLIHGQHTLYYANPRTFRACTHSVHRV